MTKGVKGDVIIDDNNKAGYCKEDMTANTKFDEDTICGEDKGTTSKKDCLISPDFEENNLGDHSEVGASDIHGKYDERHCID